MKGLCTKTFLKGLMEYSCTPNPHTFFGVRMTSAEVDMFNTWISTGILPTVKPVLKRTFIS